MAVYNTRSREREVVHERQEEWEDVIEEDEDAKTYNFRRRNTASPSNSIKNTTPRKRRPGTKTIFVAASPRKAYPSPRPRPQPPEHDSFFTQEEVEVAVKQGVRSTAFYSFDVVSTSISWLKKPLSIFLVLWLIAMILNSLSATFKAAFAPLCIIPGISRSPLCQFSLQPLPSSDPPQESPRAQHADFPQMVNIQSQTFEQLLDDSVGSSGLALEIKKAQMATSDLVTLVKVSHLTSRDLLANALSEFVEDAKRTGRGLQKLSSKVGGAVDGILAVNDYALHSIEAAASGRSSKSSIISYIFPFTHNTPTTASQTEIITESFEKALSVLSSNLARLILEAEGSLHNLDKLELQLQTIHEIAAREDASLLHSRDELLAALWTQLGGNRAQMRGFDAHLGLLKDVGTYRSRALAHVAAALQTLQALSTDMEELRERVAKPELAGGEIPLEVHVKSIRSGVERLTKGRERAQKREQEAYERILGPEVQ
ncbi:hypothetical protein BD410DRAFT_901493 [Rickenella mellea]|uniref:Uncharacterized protein n=1 Tax=Rickenella mellea TaxID=50990 RepID=A0A4Y7PPQ0_9AGAM|nr:hypothetical protein BD410DRAFT_901493 [Rickenella mellea]